MLGRWGQRKENGLMRQEVAKNPTSAQITGEPSQGDRWGEPTATPLECFQRGSSFGRGGDDFTPPSFPPQGREGIVSGKVWRWGILSICIQWMKARYAVKYSTTHRTTSPRTELSGPNVHSTEVGKPFIGKNKVWGSSEKGLWRQRIFARPASEVTEREGFKSWAEWEGREKRPRADPYGRRPGFRVLTNIHEMMCVLVKAAEVSFCCCLFLLDDDGKRQRSCGLRSPWQGTELTWTPAWKGHAHT